MFEKEAEEYLKAQCKKRKEEYVIRMPEVYIADIPQAFKDGAEFGYNKANEWHDLRKDPNDLPKPTTPVLVILESGVPYVSWISSDKGWWFCTNYYTGEDKVIKWCEISTSDKE